VKKHGPIMVLLFLISGFCSGAIFDDPSGTSMNTAAMGENAACNNTQEVANSLHVQRFTAEEEFDTEKRSKNELLRSLRVEVNPKQHLYFTSATRISGECAIHLNDINLSIYNFDTGITLVLNREGSFVPYPGQYRQRPAVGRGDAHPEVAQRQFVGAVKIGWGYFVGIWEQDGKSILTYYKEMSTGEFRIYDDMLESESKILIVRRFPALDSPSSAIQVLLQDGDDRVVLRFMWIYGELFSHD